MLRRIPERSWWLGCTGGQSGGAHPSRSAVRADPRERSLCIWAFCTGQDAPKGCSALPGGTGRPASRGMSGLQAPHLPVRVGEQPKQEPALGCGHAGAASSCPCVSVAAPEPGLAFKGSVPKRPCPSPLLREPRCPSCGLLAPPTQWERRKKQEKPELFQGISWWQVPCPPGDRRTGVGAQGGRAARGALLRPRAWAGPPSHRRALSPQRSGTARTPAPAAAPPAPTRPAAAAT